MFLDGLAKMEMDEARDLLVAVRTYQLSNLLRTRAEQELHRVKDKALSFVRDALRPLDARLGERVEGARRTLDWETASLESIAAKERARVESKSLEALRAELREEVLRLAGATGSQDDGAVTHQVLVALAGFYKLDPGLPESELEEGTFDAFMRDLAQRVATELGKVGGGDLVQVEERLSEALAGLPGPEQEAARSALGLGESTVGELLRAVGSGGAARLWPGSPEGTPQGAYLGTTLVAQAVLPGVMNTVPELARYTTLAAVGALFLRMPMVTLAALAGAGYLYRRAEQDQRHRLLSLVFATLAAKERWGSSKPTGEIEAPGDDRPR